MTLKRFLALIASLVAPLAISNVSMAQDSATIGHIGPSQAEYRAMITPPGSQLKSRLRTVAPGVVEKLAAGPTIAPTGAPGISPTSSDGVTLFHHRAGNVAVPTAYGTIKIPYTTRRVAVHVRGGSTIAAHDPVTSYPFRATGKMVVNFGANAFDCTGALIRKGLLLTAAHCLHNYGTGAAGYATAIQWIPAEFSAAASGPYGIWTGRYWVAPSFYVLGTDTCDVNGRGVVCDNDIALVVLNQKNINGTLRWPGEFVGYYAYAVNGYSQLSRRSSATSLLLRSRSLDIRRRSMAVSRCSAPTRSASTRQRLAQERRTARS
jgi:hypothetical protein